MYKSIILLLISFGFVACGGGGGGEDTSPAATLEVNLLGDWDYTAKTENSICDGLVAKGVVTINSLNGDVTKIGSMVMRGEGFDVDRYNNCIFVTVDEVDTDFQGRPAVQTANQFLAYINEDNKGDNTIKEEKLESFTKDKIISTTYYTNGVITRVTLTR